MAYRQPVLVGPAQGTITRVNVADQAARFALTVAQVQNGDFVYQTDTGVFYQVINQTSLNNANGYLAFQGDPIRLTSPDGSVWKYSADNTGQLSRTKS